MVQSMYIANRFRARRGPLFLHSQGEVLVGLAADDESDFASFMEMQDREALRFITSRINHFFGDERSKDYLRIWQSHRYDQSSRRVLYSGAVIHRSEFRILRPKLAPIMSQAFSPRNDHVLLYHPKHHARLKIDFPMFAVLAKAYRGVPALSLDGAETRRLCMFMEQLSQGDGLDEAEVVIWTRATSLSDCSRRSHRRQYLMYSGRGLGFMQVEALRRSERICGVSSQHT